MTMLKNNSIVNANTDGKSKKTKLKRLYIYTNEDEYNKILNLQQNTPLSMSEYVKRKVLGKKIESLLETKYYESLDDLDSDLRRISGLLKALLTNKEKFVGLYGQKLKSKIAKVVLLISEDSQIINEFLNKRILWGFLCR